MARLTKTSSRGQTRFSTVPGLPSQPRQLPPWQCHPLHTSLHTTRQRWTRRSTSPGIPRLKGLRRLLQPCHTGDELEVPGEEGEEVEVKLKIQGVEETEGELQTIQVPPNKMTSTPNTRPQGTPTYPHSSPAGAIGPMGNPHTIVRSRQPVLGKTSGSLSQTCNETVTNLTVKMTTSW